MKVSFQNTILSVMALAALASCSRFDELNGAEQGAGDYSIDLSVFCQSLETKAAKPGEGTYNENTLSYVDWFVFHATAGAGDTFIPDAGDAVAHGRATSGSIGSICLDGHVDASHRTFYVYAVANIPSTVATNHDALPITLAGLKALSHTASFNHQDPFLTEGIQSSFIMRGGAGVTFADSDRKVAKGLSIPLQRLAAKVTVNLNVAPAIDELETMPDGSQHYIQTWYPDVTTMQVYLSFANDVSTLDGTPISYDNDKFFTYYRTGFTPAIPDPGPSWSSAPSWVQDKWSITGTPFYSYPMTWASESPQAPFLKVILKWTAYDESQGDTVDPVRISNPGGEDDNKFIRHQRSKPASFKRDEDKEFYYKIPLVPMSEDSGTLNANDWYEITADLSILGSTSDELPVILNGQYYVTGWGTGSSTFSGELKQPRYLALERYEYEFYAKDEITIPVFSSHDLVSYSVISATYKDYATTTPQTKNLATLNTGTKQLNSPDEISFDNNSSFTLRHALNTNLTSTDVDCSRITYVLTVTNKAGLTSQPITIVQYPPLYIEAETSNHTVFINNNGNTFADQSSSYPSRFFDSKTIPLYDDGNADYTYTLSSASNTLTSAMSYQDEHGVKVIFDTANSGVNKQITEAHRTIEITAPSPYWVYKVEIGYSTNAGTWAAGHSKGITYTADIKSFDQSSNKLWYGEARTLTLYYNATASNTGTNLEYIINSIKVYYHNSNFLGTIAHPNKNSAQNNGNLYKISVTDVSGLGFFITDTRSASAVNYPQLKQNSASGTPLSDYRPLDTDPYNNNAIAPKFIVASTYGGSYGGGMRFESAIERCASYQENGYPAGRWRLPTDAEIKFIVNLSAHGRIPTLFNGSYWGSSGSNGTCIRVNPPGFHKLDYTPQAVGTDETEVYEDTDVVASIRCVYPIWYWGEHQFDGNDGYANFMSTWSGWQNN